MAAVSFFAGIASALGRLAESVGELVTGESAQPRAARARAICRVCKGTGVYADRFAVVDCDACDGEGWVKREEPQP